MDGAVLYFRIYALGLPALAIYNFGNGVLSASGETKLPLIYLSIAGVLNVLLNDTILSFFIICLACVFSILFSVYYIGLTVSERIFLKKRISAFLLYHKDVWKSFDRKYGLKK